MITADFRHVLFHAGLVHIIPVLDPPFEVDLLPLSQVLLGDLSLGRAAWEILPVLILLGAYLMASTVKIGIRPPTLDQHPIGRRPQETEQRFYPQAGDLYKHYAVISRPTQLQ